ncbi:MAG: metallophosphoesterase [Treponema sp.]|nr:metallophosphoesterase [Treponema sp.]
MSPMYQLDSKIFSTSSDIGSVTKKSDYSILVISDSHGNIQLLSSILNHFQDKIDALFFCGDGIYDILAALESLTSIPPIISLVQGNGDASIVSTETNGQVLCIPEKTVLNLGPYTILSTHGHKQNIYYTSKTLVDQAATLQCNVVFYGHTHIARQEMINDTLLINPGSCSLPRGGQKPSFAIVSIRTNPQSFITCTFFEIKRTTGYSFIPMKNR